MRKRLYQIIFEAETRAGRSFDVVLLWLIVGSVLLVFMESVPTLGRAHARFFMTTEWVVTVIFSLEYLTRIWVSPRPWRYIFSFWGFVDLVSILPTYLSLLFTGYHYLLVIRIFRLLRVFRVLKLVRFIKASEMLYTALRSSSVKISIFLLAITAIVVTVGTLMYVLEGGANGFESIPQSIYWAIVTVTTVGYGDIVPHSFLGKLLSSMVMIIGYAIIAVPTGIITVEMSRASAAPIHCKACGQPNPSSARFCNHCGQKLLQSDPEPPPASEASEDDS